jgi:hypothetical protein
MVWTKKGNPDADLQETRAYLAERLSTDGNFDYAICLRESEK